MPQQTHGSIALGYAQGNGTVAFFRLRLMIATGARAFEGDTAGSFACDKGVQG